MRRPTLFALVAILAAAVAVLFWTDSSFAPEAEAGVDAPAETGEFETPAGTAVADRRRVLEGGGVAAKASAQPSADSPGARPGESLSIVVRVVDGASGAAVPFAEVAVMRQEFNWFGMSADERHRVRRFGEDRVALLAHFGAKERADAEGRLRLSIETSLFLACADAGRFGELSLRSAALEPNREPRLLLLREANLRVRIVDAGKTPLPGFPLDLSPVYTDRHGGGQKPAGMGVSHVVRPWAFTDHAGLATLHRLPAFVERHKRVVGTAPERASVGFAVPCVEVNALVFDPLDPPGGIVELIAPPTGVVVVKLHDPSGALLGSYEDLSLRRPGHDGLAKTSSAPLRWEGQPAGKGAARFPYVTLGGMLEAEARGDFEVEPHRFRAPTKPGELVEVSLRVTGIRDVLTGRLVDEQLRPLGRMHLRIPFGGENFGDTNYLLMTSDEDGGFRYDCEGLVGERITLLFAQKVVRQCNAPLLGQLSKTLKVPHGRTDLGMIVMHPAPLLASGRVEIDGKSPAQRPDLAVETRDGGGDWGKLRSGVVTWGKPGHFEVRGRASAASHRLIPSATDCQPAEPLEFHAGQRGLRLLLRRGGSLRVDLQLDDRLLAKTLAFELRPERPAPALTRALTWRGRSPAGVFHDSPNDEAPAVVWRGLAPGEYRFELRAFGLLEPLADLHGLVVPPGRSCEDPRMQPLDLRGKLTRVSLTVLDPSGKPSGSGAVWGTGDRALGAWLSSGKANLTIAGPADLTVAVRGYRIERPHGVRGDLTVRLRALPTVRIKVPRVTPPAGTGLHLLATPVGLPGDEAEVRIGRRCMPVRRFTEPKYSRTSLGTARTVELPVRLGEELKLTVWLQRDAAGVEVRGCSPVRLRLGLNSGTVPLTVPRDAVLAALQELDR